MNQLTRHASVSIANVNFVTPFSHCMMQNLPNDWQCPICGAEARTFQSRARVIAGFAENQGYGLGGNSLTSGQKSALIYGSLLVGFSFFIFGYFLQ
jgi:hypothetical protein